MFGPTLHCSGPAPAALAGPLNSNVRRLEDGCLGANFKGENMKNLASVCIVLLAVTACASHTGIVQMGRDTYMVAKQQATGFPGLGNMKAELIAEASGYCAEKGLELQIVSTHETQPPYVLGNYPRSEIQFMCLAANDRELQRPKLQKAPDTVI